MDTEEYQQQGAGKAVRVVAGVKIDTGSMPATA
jgi:hypothetical protein